MNKSAWIFGVAVLALGLAAGQQMRPKRLAPATAQTDTVPVTRAEARQVVMRMEKLLTRGLDLKLPAGKLVIPETPGAVTRVEVVKEFNRLFVQYQPSFKFTPPKVKFDKSVITLSDPNAKPALEKLIAWGTVAKIGPIACASVQTLTVHQFGDAVGFYMSRVADLTHLPPSRWTPYLNGGRS
jgi:hypothetical protein